MALGKFNLVNLDNNIERIELQEDLKVQDEVRFNKYYGGFETKIW